MNAYDVILLDIGREDIIKAIKEAKKLDIINNTRDQSPIVAFDSKVREYIGDTALRRYFHSNGIKAENSNRSEKDGCDLILTLKSGKKALSCEVTTSKMPAFCSSAEDIIRSCDIRVIKRRPDTDIDVDSDIYIQIYYAMSTVQRDDLLIELFEKDDGRVPEDPELMYEKYFFSAYLCQTFFIAWDDKSSIEKKLNEINEDKRTYTIANRVFWNDKIRTARKPADIIGFIKE